MQKAADIDAEALQARLFAACYAGNVDRVNGLLIAGADLNAWQESTGLAALHIAIGTNNGELTTFLIAKGAKCGPDKHGRWPTVIAALCGVDDELAELVEKTEDEVLAENGGV